MRVFALIAALALLVGGCGEEEDVSPNFEDRIPPGIELEAEDRVVTLGGGTTLSGTLTQGDEKLANEPVVLEADPYPFRGDFSELESVSTDDDGSFSFEVSPDANTSYRIAAGELSETTSRERVVYVEPQISLETEAIGNGTRFTTVFRHPEDRSIQGSNLFSYAVSAAEAEEVNELPFIRIDRVEQVKPGLSEASIVLPFPAESVRYESCVSYTGDAGLGVPNPRCSQSSFQAD